MQWWKREISHWHQHHVCIEPQATMKPKQIPGLELEVAAPSTHLVRNSSDDSTMRLVQNWEGSCWIQLSTRRSTTIFLCKKQLPSISPKVNPESVCPHHAAGRMFRQYVVWHGQTLWVLTFDCCNGVIVKHLLNILDEWQHGEEYPAATIIRSRHWQMWWTLRLVLAPAWYWDFSELGVVWYKHQWFNGHILLLDLNNHSWYLY